MTDFINMVLTYYAWVMENPVTYANNITFLGEPINSFHRDAKYAIEHISDEDNAILTELWDTYVRPIIYEPVEIACDREWAVARAEGRTKMVGEFEVVMIDDPLVQKLLAE